MKIRRARKPRTPMENLYLPTLSEYEPFEEGGTKNDSHKVSPGSDSRR